MSISFSEKEIQDKIWERGRNIGDLIEERISFNREGYQDDLSGLTPENIMMNLISTRLEKAYEKFKSVYLVGKEVALTKRLDSPIRADFIGIPEGSNGFCIVELKKSAQTERESFTELLGYSNHFVDIFPTLTKADVLLCLITPVENRIVKEAYLCSLLFDKKMIVMLIPVFPDGTLDSILLKPWIPQLDDIINIQKTFFLQKNFSVFKVNWENVPGYWNPETERYSSSEMINRMNCVSTIAAQLMEEQSIHGFVYSSQTWTELKDALPYTNSLVIVGLNPFSIAGNQLDLTNNNPSGYNEYQLSMSHRLSDFIPSLGKFEKEEESNFVTERFENLHTCWEENLSRIGLEVANFALSHYNGGTHGVSYSSFSWKIYQEEMLEHVLCDNYDLKTTGLIREIYFEAILSDYSFERGNHPVLGDFHKYAVDYASSHDSFFTFLNRMLHEYGSGGIE
jgi:hypothetical protein